MGVRQSRPIGITLRIRIITWSLDETVDVEISFVKTVLLTESVGDAVIVVVEGSLWDGDVWIANFSLVEGNGGVVVKSGKVTVILKKLLSEVFIYKGYVNFAKEIKWKTKQQVNI